MIKHALTITHVGIFFTQRSENVRRNTLQRERGVAIRAATRRLQLKLRNLNRVRFDERGSCVASNVTKRHANPIRSSSRAVNLGAFALITTCVGITFMHEASAKLRRVCSEREAWLYIRALWGIGQVERMSRTIKDATVKRYPAAPSISSLRA